MGTTTGTARRNTGRPAATLKSTFSSVQQVRTAMLAKLQQSALTAADAKLLQLNAYTAQEVETRFKTLPVHRAGILIPYFDFSGRISKFFRFRFLEYGEAEGGFRSLVAATGKPLRYAQPNKTLNELYMPPFIDWQDYALDRTKPLVFTEGEFKAACATKHGVPTIGLGGVWCFKSNAQHMPLLPQFEHFNFRERDVYICYDSDAASNNAVVQAQNALARELMLKGAIPKVCSLPAPAAGGKCGVDDYIVANGVEQFAKEILEKAVEWKAAQELYSLNEEVLYVTDPGVILKLENLQRMTPRAFVEHAYAPRVYFEEQITQGGVKLVERSAAKEWLKWPQRATVQRVTYIPGQPRVTVDGELNVWRGWGCAPVAGSVKPWTQLLDYLFSGSPATERHWFEQWCAYPLQHPAEKLYSAVVLWGLRHGTGKSLLGYTMFRIYGANATEIGDRDLHSTHNEWAEHKQFVMGEEITGGDKRNVADRMKSMITQKLLRLNPKYVPSYTVPDCINYYFTSNHPDAFFLEDDDRRFFIHEVRGAPLEGAFYKGYMEWLNASGAANLFDYLLHLDLSGFDPQGHAMVTASKLEMVDNGRSDVGAWVAALRDDPDRLLRVAGKPLAYSLFTSEDMRMLYDPENRTRVTANGLGRELRRGGFQKVYSGMGVLTEVSGRQRLWAVRNAEKLLRMNGPELGKIYDSERGGLNGNRKTKF